MMSPTRLHRAAGCAVAACLGCLVLGLGGGCGRKLPPIQPGALPPPMVADLAFDVHAGQVVLFWDVPAVDPAKERPAAGFKVLRARQTLVEAECPSCPVPFQAIADIVASGRSPGSRMQFRDSLEPGYKHSYKLWTYTSDERVGRDSNTVAVSY